MRERTSGRLARAVTSERTAEQLRRFAARTTEEIVLRRGRELDMWVGCGYPKSGTVWLCQLMSAYLDKPYPRDYQLPIAMSSVIHAHWSWDRRLPPTVYIVRDGRDVLVSLYFHQVRMLGTTRNPRRRHELEEIFTRLFGPGYDLQDSRANLARYIEFEMTERDTLSGWNWAEHVRHWTGRDNVAVVRYEDLLVDTAAELQRAMSELSAPRLDPRLADLAAQRYEFGLASGRDDGTEDRSSFLRKGVAGDWRSHFTREAAEIFDAHAGDVLRELEYADEGWWEEL